MPQPARWPYDPSSPLHALPRGMDDTEWAAVFQSDDDEMTDAFDIGAFLQDFHTSEQDAANRWAYQGESPRYPEITDLMDDPDEDEEPNGECRRCNEPCFLRDGDLCIDCVTLAHRLED